MKLARVLNTNIEQAIALVVKHINATGSRWPNAESLLAAKRTDSANTSGCRVPDG